MTDTVVLKTLIPNLTDAEINDCIQRKNKHLIAIFNELKPSEKEQYLTPGLFSFLRFLKNENKKIAVVSASEDIIVHETLRCFDINPFVQIEMGRNQTALTKPNPDPYIEAMKRFNVHSNETIIFEDSPTGLLSAKRSMAQVIRITAFAHDQNEANKVNDLSDISEIKDFTFAH
jgi:HAD superfamily hydrolase (TIGR01509 family)